MLTKPLFFLMPVVYLCHCGPAHAFDLLTIQLGVNHSTADTVVIGDHLLDEPLPTLSDTFSGTATRAGATVHVYRWFHFDVGWARFGNEDRYTNHFFEDLCPGICPPGEGFMVDNIEQSGSGYWVAAAPAYETGSWRIMGKFGVARTSIQSQRASDQSNKLRVKETGLMLGLGVGFQFTEHLGVRFDFDQLGREVRQAGLGLSFRL